MSAASTGRGISTARSICIHLLCFPFSFLQILWHCGGTSMQCPFMILHLCGLQRMAVCLICRAQRIINRLSKLCRAHISSSHALHAQNLKTSTEKTNKTQTELQKLSDIRFRQSVSWTPLPRPQASISFPPTAPTESLEVSGFPCPRLSPPIPGQPIRPNSFWSRVRVRLLIVPIFLPPYPLSPPPACGQGCRCLGSRLSLSFLSSHQPFSSDL